MVLVHIGKIAEQLQKRLSPLLQFLKRNYRNYYDDRSWWDEIGS